MVEVEVHGIMHADEQAVHEELMAHLAAQTGIDLKKSDGGAAKPGLWHWLAARDPSANPGRARLFLEGPEQVGVVKEALHGKAIKIGMDSFSISVSYDPDDARRGPAA